MINQSSESYCQLRLVFSRFFYIRGISEMLKKNQGFSSFLPFTDWKNPTILVCCQLKIMASKKYGLILIQNSLASKIYFSLVLVYF